MAFMAPTASLPLAKDSPDLALHVDGVVPALHVDGVVPRVVPENVTVTVTGDDGVAAMVPNNEMTNLRVMPNNHMVYPWDKDVVTTEQGWPCKTDYENDTPQPPLPSLPPSPPSLPSPLPSPEQSPSPSLRWTVVKGPSYCSVPTDGMCITDGIGSYGLNEACTMQAEMSMTMTAKGFATAPISFTAFNPTAASSSSSAVSSDSASTVNAVLETRGKWGSLILLGLILLCLLRALALEAHVAKAERNPSSRRPSAPKWSAPK
jgi:hypothetical protein